MKVFISYAHDDQTFVEQLEQELAKRSCDAWYDRKPGVGLRGGETWQARLQSELASRPSVCVVLSPYATRNGSFVENEYLFALSKHARVIPLMFRPCDVPLALINLQYIDFSQQPFAAALDQLISALGISSDAEPAEPRVAANPFGDRGRIEQPARFFDRTQELRQVFDTLAEHNCASIIGDNFMGRSSLLYQVFAQGPAQLDVQFIYLTLEVINDDRSFFEHVGTHFGVSKMRDRDLARVVGQRRVVLCIDEMEKMNVKGFRGGEHLRSFLRGMANGQSAPLKLVSVSQRPLRELFAADETPHKPSPLHNLFVTTVRLTNFSRTACDAFLDERLKHTGVAFDQMTRDEIWSLTQGHPYKLHRAAHHRYRAAADSAYDWRSAYRQDTLHLK